MAAVEIQEKRKHKRTRYLRTVDILIGKDIVRGAAMDLSGGGMAIISDRPLPASETCTIRNKSLKVQGQVLYSEAKRGIATDRPVFRCGIRFLSAMSLQETERLLVSL